MQYSVFSQKSKINYLIPILLLTGSFSLYSYNLIGQPIWGDEVFYLSWGGVYFDLIKKGDLNNPCLNNLAECELLYSHVEIEEGKIPSGLWYINYTPIRNFLVGFSQFITTGENKGDFYEWSCMWANCWDDKNYPSQEELASGRFFSTIFGSLTVVLAFFIGKTLFNRTTGLIFSFILLFYSLWLVNSRLIMSDVYLYFFIMLSILLLLQSFKKENKHRILFFIFSAITFGIALNIKLIALEMIIPILIMVLVYDSFNKKLNFRFFKNKKNVLKVTSLVLVFFTISSVTFLATSPRYYDDTFNQILKIREETKTVLTSMPTLEKNYLYRTVSTSLVILFPYLIDLDADDDFIVALLPYFVDPDSNVSEDRSTITLGWGIPYNHSTIPLTLFFLIGLIYIIKNIKDRNLKFSEFTVLVWASSLFILTVLIVNEPNIERYYLPIMFPVILIASYGLWRFIQKIKNQKEKILFFLSFMVAHSLYVISLFDGIYFSGGLMPKPLPVYSQLALQEPLVYVSTIIFVIIFGLVYYRTKNGTIIKNKIT